MIGQCQGLQSHQVCEIRKPQDRVHDGADALSKLQEKTLDLRMAGWDWRKHAYACFRPRFFSVRSSIPLRSLGKFGKAKEICFADHLVERALLLRTAIATRCRCSLVKIAITRGLTAELLGVTETTEISA